MNSRRDELMQLRSQVIANGYVSATECYVESARGAVIYDMDGREFIDFAGGIGVMNVGHSHPKVVAAIRDQAERFTHTCFTIAPYEAPILLAEKLCSLTPGAFPKKTLYVNSGAEAVENAIKICRYFSKKPAVIAFENAFHGRTSLTMALTSKVKPYKFGFGPFPAEVYRMPSAYCYRCPLKLDYPRCDIACADYMKEFFISNVAAETIAALIIEPVQGEGGFITPPPEYFARLIDICHDNDIIFIDDEIQSGMGRTGKMFAIEHWNVVPDMITTAKSLAAGMPLSAVVGKADIMDSVYPMGVGSTYGANPVACRASLAVMEIFEEEDLLVRAERLGEKVKNYFKEMQDEFEIIGDVRGMGPMRALELVKDRESKVPAADEAKALTRFCADRGLIVLACGTFGNVIRTLIPLVITDDQLERGMAIMRDGLKELRPR